MMMIGKYKIKKAIAGIGFYCDINLSVKKDEYSAGVVKIEFEDETIADQFKLAIRSGVYYFLEKKHQTQGIKSIVVKVNRIHLMPVDSTFMLVMFGTKKALYKAFGWEDSALKINALGNIELPK